MFKFVSAVALVILALSIGASEDPKIDFKKDVVYGKAGDDELKMDLAVPDGKGPYPCLVLIHGGGWARGSKSAYDKAVVELAKHGYVAATVEYRFAPKFQFPAQIEDCKCAVRYLRKHADELHVNTEKFGAMGDSAGGHLSLLLDLMNKEDGCEGTSGCEGVSSKVQAVVNYYGPGDFLAPVTFSPYAKILVAAFLGTGDQNSPIVKKASPATYIDKSDGPVLTFHGSADPLVPLDMSKRLHAELKEAGVEEKLEILEGKSHGWGGEDRKKTDAEALEFFDKHLK